MRQKSEWHQGAAERTINDIRRRTRKRYSSEEKIRIVLSGLRGEDSIAELCRQEASPRACITAGQRNSAKLARSGSGGGGEAKRRAIMSAMGQKQTFSPTAF